MVEEGERVLGGGHPQEKEEKKERVAVLEVKVNVGSQTGTGLERGGKGRATLVTSGNSPFSNASGSSSTSVSTHIYEGKRPPGSKSYLQIDTSYKNCFDERTTKGDLVDLHNSGISSADSTCSSSSLSILPSSLLQRRRHTHTRFLARLLSIAALLIPIIFATFIMLLTFLSLFAFVMVSSNSSLSPSLSAFLSFPCPPK